MKFVCRKCETFMAFQEVEPVSDGSLGITFRCGTCDNAIAMVTNAGETQMVKSLGVSLGGRDDAPAPLEMTRASLDDGATRSTPSPATVAAADSLATAMQTSTGKCPFANSLATTEAKRPQVPSDIVAWTEAATVRLTNVPDMIRPVARQLIEGMARDLGRDVVDDEIMDLARDRFM